MNLIKDFRIRHNVSQETLARHLKVSRNTIMLWEHSNKPLKEVVRLAIENLDRQIKEGVHVD